MARDLHHRRPLRQHRNRRRRQRREVTGGVNHFAINHRQHRLNAFDLLFRDAEIVLRQHHQIGKLTGGQTALLPCSPENRAPPAVHSSSATSRGRRLLSSYIAIPPTVRPETSQYSAVHGL